MPLAPYHVLVRIFPGLPDLAGRVAPSTLKHYESDVQMYLHFCQWDKERALDPATLRAWRTHLVDEGRAAPTINRRLAAVKSIVRSCVAHGAPDFATAYGFALVEPVRSRTLRHRRRRGGGLRLTPEQVRDLWRIPNPITLKGTRDRALLATFAASGCRISEIVTLRRSQIFWAHGRGTIEVTGKNQDRPRRAPLTREAYDWICRWLERRAKVGIDVEPIFTTFAAAGRVPTGIPLTRSGAYDVVKRAAKEAGIPDAKPHDFRRFVGSELAKRHGLLVTQRALGHKRPDTTSVYILDDPDLEQLTEGLW